MVDGVRLSTPGDAEETEFRLQYTITDIIHITDNKKRKQQSEMWSGANCLNIMILFGCPNNMLTKKMLFAKSTRPYQRTLRAVSLFSYSVERNAATLARACTLVPSLNLKTRETAGCLYPMGALDQCLKFVKHLDWTRKVEQAKETWFRCIDRATIPTMQLRGKKIAELEEYSGNCSLKHLPSGFSVCTVIYGKDLVSSQCIKGRTEEKREAPLRAPNCLSIFLCEIYKWRLGTSLYLKSDSHFDTACVRVFFFGLRTAPFFSPVYSLTRNYRRNSYAYSFQTRKT